MKRRSGIAADERARACRRCRRVPSSRSIAVTRIGAPRAARRAEAKRAASGAMPLPGFSGLPGETSHQISSSPSASSAARLIRRCPRWAGLKEPPRRPVRVMRAAIAWPRGGANGLDARPRLGHDRRRRGAMVSGIEGVGEAVTGGMLARAVEPEAGEDGQTHDGALPQLRRRADRALLPRMRPEGAMSTARSPPSGTISSTACSISTASSGGPCRCSPGGPAS